MRGCWTDKKTKYLKETKNDDKEEIEEREGYEKEKGSGKGTERRDRVLQRVKNRVRYTERQVSQASKW